MYLVIKWTGTEQVAIDADGTEHANYEQAELFATKKEAATVAAQFGGQVDDEDRIFGVS